MVKKHLDISEGKYKKGGVNSYPVIPPPKDPPKGQGGSNNIRRNNVHNQKEV